MQNSESKTTILYWLLGIGLVGLILFSILNPPASVPAQSTGDTASKQTSQADCDPNYDPCVPNVAYDLDCGDISTSVRVTGTDRHRFDRDGDGYGCETN